MRITALEVEGFGVWSGLKLDPLSDGLNVFYGPNEAGKTTLMQFVRTVLYGLSPERRQYLPPVHGGRPGGTLQLVAPNGPYRVGRFDNIAAGGHEELLLQNGDGARQGEHVLKSLLCGVDETVFNNVFAVGLRELQELATLNDTEAAAQLYSLSAGLDRVSLMEVARELTASRNRLLDARGQGGHVPQWLAERDRLRGELRELETLGRRYERIAVEREQLERETSRLDEESKQLADQVRLLEIALNLRERWRQRTSLDEQIAALGPVEEFPEGAMERLRSLDASLEDRQRQRDERKRQWDDVRRETAELTVNEALWRQSPRIEALHEQADWIENLETRILELETEIAEAQTRLDEEHKRFGFADGTMPAVSARSLDALRRPATAVRRCRQQLEESQQRVRTAEETAATLEEQVQSAMERRGERSLSDASERVGNLVTQLRRRVQLDERIGQMERHQAELEEESEELLDRQMMPMPKLLGLGAMFVGGALLVMIQVVSSVFFSGPLFGYLGWPLAALGLGVTVAAVAAKFHTERSNTRRTEKCHRQLKVLHLQLKQAKEERDSLDHQLPEGGGPLLVRLQAAERELAGLEELVPLDARRRAARAEADTAAASVRQAEADLSSAVRRWKEATAAAGLPKGLSPKQVKQLAARCDAIQETRQRRDRRQEELEQRRTELESVNDRIARLARETGLEPGGLQPVEQLRAMAEQMAQQEARLKQRETLRQQGRQLRRQWTRLETGVKRLKSRRRSLLDRLGVKDEKEFHQRAARLAHAESLRSRREALQREIQAAIAGQCDEQAVAALLEGDGSANLEGRRQQLHSRREACEVQLRHRYEKRGQLNEQLRLLAENREPAKKQIELAAVEKRLDDALHRWKVLAVTGQILESVRKNYEQTRQPETLQEASQYLGQFTQGRYRRVWTPLSDEVLLVDDASGESHPVERLSRGTREQLFLCLRLALCSCYARRGVELPLVFDDVLVNFDSHRAKAAVGVFCEYAAAGRQLLVFTCHEHIAEMFQLQGVDVHTLPSHGNASAVVAVAAKPPRPKRKRKTPQEDAVVDSPVPQVQPPVAPPKPAPEPEPEPAPQDAWIEPMEDLAPWEEDDSEAFEPEEDEFIEFDESLEEDSLDAEFEDSESEEDDDAFGEEDEEEEEEEQFDDEWDDEIEEESDEEADDFGEEDSFDEEEDAFEEDEDDAEAA